MRDVLENLLGTSAPDHLGLAYDRWAPVERGTGKIPDRGRAPFLKALAQTRIPGDYKHAYGRWLKSLRADSSRAAEVTLASRLLVGHGNSAPTEVGLTVHHTWGVPMIPGSALKGLLNHAIDAVYGPDELGAHPMDASLSEETKERARFRGVTWDKRHPLYGPGEVHRALFGAPSVRNDKDYPGSGETVGGVIFHDALFVPGSAGDQPFAEDVLTVHQKTYYDKRGTQGGPNDYDDPIPVSFLTVKPGAAFLVALSGAPEWTAFALRELLWALVEWGVGGKTAAGYGRIRRDAWDVVAGGAFSPEAPGAPEALEARGPLDELEAWLARSEPRPQRELLALFRSDWLPRRGDIAEEDRKAIYKRLGKEIKSRKLVSDMTALRDEWLV